MARAESAEKGASGRGAAGGDVRFGDVPEELVEACFARIDAALEEKTVASPLLRKLRRSIERERLVLPVVPTTLARVLGLLEREDVQVSDLAFSIEADPALAMKVVGVANSSFYGGIESVVSVHDALMRTGLEQAKTIVAGVAIRSSVFKAPGFDDAMDSIWRRSVSTALATLALLEDNVEWRDSAFLLGLVHDVGRIVLLATIASEYEGKSELPSPEAIEAAGNAIRCELGAVALASWAFGDELVDAVTWQESPDECPEESRSLTWGLYAGDTLMNLVELGWQPGENEDADRMVNELIEPMGIGFERIGEILMLVEGGVAAFTKLV